MTNKTAVPFESAAVLRWTSLGFAIDAGREQRIHLLATRNREFLIGPVVPTLEVAAGGEHLIVRAAVLANQPAEIGWSQLESAGALGRGTARVVAAGCGGSHGRILVEMKEGQVEPSTGPSF